MSKFIAAIVREKNGTCTVLRCSAGGRDSRGNHLPRRGRILERLRAKNYGDAVYQVALIEGRLV